MKRWITARAVRTWEYDAETVVGMDSWIRQISADRCDQQWWADNFWNRVQSLDQLRAMIMKHSSVFAARGVKNYHSKKLKPTPIVDICLDLRWSDHVSNSHSCPHDGVTNWGRRGEQPTGYPGWTGRVEYVVQSHRGQLFSYPGGSDQWTGTRIHTGGGGGGGHRDQETQYLQSFGYQVELFASDWPAMAQAYDQARMWRELKGQHHENLDQVVNDMFPVDQAFLGESL